MANIMEDWGILRRGVGGGMDTGETSMRKAILRGANGIGL
jgi:hypothetical protein